MPNTTNFNWATPADTDLVKDGAAAIRTLGNSIDSSFVDLKGGTTGQNLRKASGTDLDFIFAGDATNTVVDAAGDLLYGTAADTLGRLAIGTAGQVLQVNSGATAPEWATPSGSSFAGVSLTKSASQNIAGSTETVVTWDTENFDVGGYHSTVTNTGRITIPSGKAGYYQFNTYLGWEASGTSGLRSLQLHKNGTMIARMNPQIYGDQQPAFGKGITFYGAVSDYFEIRTYVTGGNWDVLGDNTRIAISSFDAFFLGA